MRGFYVVFDVVVHHDGPFVFSASGGCIIRRGSERLFENREADALSRYVIHVRAGDRLQVAHWHLEGEWWWTALAHQPESRGVAQLKRYLTAIRRRLDSPDGPVLKLFVSGQSPFRCALCIYSMILNGYAPERVLVYGEHQWGPATRELFAALLPFAEIVPTRDVEWHLERLYGRPLVNRAQQHWGVMKTCATMLTPPGDYCLMDDDVWVLESCQDALRALETHHLVFAQDGDYGDAYVGIWGSAFSVDTLLTTGRVNTGLYWVRPWRDPAELAQLLVRVPIDTHPPWQWEQGFLAAAYARATVHGLPTSRYFYPYHDGMPGGVLGYPYAENPCGFATIHFGGLREKPDDCVAELIVDGVLSRRLER